ncbi:hypothetical protein COL26b_003507 [Colletotrichum chrysophilum]|uniref:uncharacterized protein n=1 Tax=Colletotrichum chrysophilum TaxID=1836956 RepID=UPI0023012494|nr:uncharacterized protein COL26b_003507 [Colletotrichum chrysophilum]KAJ0378345.1 hypothetical protein COL26b_003507 [Colletotrichum chrysophilum]
MATLSGAERIRAITDEDGMFKAFDTYPWKKDKMFLSGLTAILGDPNTANPKGTTSELATHARIFYYASRIGVTVDFNSYKDWLARHPDHTPPDILPEEYKSQSPATTTATDVPDLTSKLNDLKTDPDPKNDAGAEDTPSWQAAAPKGELYVERKAPPQVEADAEGGEPAYPVGFAEMLQMLQKGIPIPGIRQIPDTVIRDASVKPFGKRAVPKKPWEKDVPTTTDAEAGDQPSVVDAEFPPLDETSAPEADKSSKDT